MSSKFTLLCGVLVFVLACAGAPVQEMSDARQAIRSAEEVDAARHSPQPLYKARQLLEQAETQLGIGAYGEARRLALDARDQAIRARERALASSAPYPKPP